jgi:hypothetical protein
MLISISAPLAQVAQAQEVTLTILNPKGAIERIPITPLAERLDTLEGMKIAQYSISVPGNLTAVQQILAERFGPSADTAAGTIAANPLQVSYGSLNAKGGVDHQDTLTNYEGGARAADAVIVGTAF